MTEALRRPRHAIPGALVAPLVGALMILGAPAATYAAPRQPPRPPAAGNPPAAGSDEGHGSHSGRAENPDPNGGRADKAKPGPGDNGTKPDPNAGRGRH